MKTAIILAGGKGTRIRKFFPGIPKPLIPVAGVPFIERIIRQMKIYGFYHFVITVGYEAEKIMSYLGDGSRYGVNIDYFVEQEPLGSGGALPYIADKLKGTVAIVSADLVFNIDWNAFYRFHQIRRADITMLVHPTLHPEDSDLVVLHHGWYKVDGKWRHIWDEKDRVIGFYRKGETCPDTVRNIANAGIMLIESDILKNIAPQGFMNLEHDIVFPLVKNGYRVFGYRSPEYVKDAGTPERFKQVEKDINSGVVKYWNLGIKKPAVFWDRDGTINVYKGYILKPDDIELMEGVADKIKEYRQKGYLNIVMTNQPQISFGWLSFDDLEKIHGRLEWLLAQHGAYVDDIYYCPTHEDSGFKGEIPELKGYFSCRKPLPGMVYEAADRYNIDVNSSIVVGDSDSDENLARWVDIQIMLVGRI